MLEFFAVGPAHSVVKFLKIFRGRNSVFRVKKIFVILSLAGLKVGLLVGY